MRTGLDRLRCPSRLSRSHEGWLCWRRPDRGDPQLFRVSDFNVGKVFGHQQSSIPRRRRLPGVRASADDATTDAWRQRGSVASDGPSRGPRITCTSAWHLASSATLAACLLLIVSPPAAATQDESIPAVEPSPTAPSLTLTPKSGVAGDVVAAMGENLYCGIGAGNANNDVIVQWDNGDELAKAVTIEGRFEAEFTVPTETARGQYTVTARCVGSDESVSETLTILSAAGPTSTPTELDGVGAEPDPEPPAAGGPLESQLDRGVIVFNKPESLRVGDPERVVVRIATDELEEIYEDFEGAGEVKEQPIPVSRVMRVTLLADATTFTVNSLSSEDQLVLDQAVTQWEWVITPMRPGSHTLTIRASVLLVDPSHGEKPIDRTVLTERVRVDINPAYSVREFAASNWQWLWTVVVIPVGAAVLRAQRRRSVANEMPANPASIRKRPPRIIGPSAMRSGRGRQALDSRTSRASDTTHP